MDDKTIKIAQLVLAVLVLYLVYKLFKSIGQKLDIVDDEKDIASAALVEDKSNIWSPKYWKNKKNVQLLTNDSAKALAKKIYRAHGTFGNVLMGGGIDDKEEEIYAVFRNLSHKTQLSYLSYYFYKIYGEDLLQFLRSFLNNDELATIAQIVSKYK